MAADGGDRRDADQMPPPTLDEVLQSERRHRREPGDIDGDRVGLGAPLQLRILAPRPGRNDEHINAADFGDQVACSCSGLGDIDVQKLEAHYLAGGDVPRVIRALIAAQRADLDLDFDRACAIDLAGRDVLDAVQTSVNPKVIDCPDTSSGKTTLSAVAKNGVELKIRARVTVRTNLQQLIGGATEETIIARVGEGIITSIGSAPSHFKVMEHPDTISKAVLERGLDAQTAFQIVSIDIADIEVGENIGARLQADQAEADTRVARAKAEERRAVAIAREQEMKAATADNRARLLQAEALVPKSIGEAYRAGRIQLPANGQAG